MHFPKRDVAISGNTLLKFTCLSLYAWKRGKKYLYIGMSKGGMTRITSHNIINKVEPVRKRDTIDIWFMPNKTYLEVMAIEAALVKEHRPKYNVINVDYTCKEIKCLGCNTVFMQKRWWQRFHSSKCRTSRTFTEDTH